MQDPTNVGGAAGGEQTGGEQTGGAAGGEQTGGNNQPTDLSLQDMLTGITGQLGGAPSGREGAPQMDDIQKGIVDKQFEQDVRFQLEDMQKEVKGKIPDVSDTQAYHIGVAMMKGDIAETIDAVRDALKREAEMDEKNEKQTSLHVEGGASGKAEQGKLEGLGNTFDKMNRQYSSA